MMPEYATSKGRFAHHDELDALINAWTSTRDLMEVFHTLQAAGIPSGPQLDNDLLAVDPHVSARGWLRPLTTTEAERTFTSVIPSSGFHKPGAAAPPPWARTTSMSTGKCSACPKRSTIAWLRRRSLSTTTSTPTAIRCDQGGLASVSGAEQTP